jgi:peptide/nickel transport system permease protein
LPDQPSLLRGALAVVVLAVGSNAFGDLHRELASALRTALASGYVEAARARGAPIWPHVLRNLVAPVTTMATTRLAMLVGGLVILEKVLLLNGLGSLLWQAAEGRDYNLALGITLVLATIVTTGRLVGDAVRLAVDPRLRSAR